MIIRANELVKLSTLKKQIHLPFWSDMFFHQIKKISFHLVSFIKLKNDLIYEMDEYWSDDCEAPSWRRELKIGKLIQ